MQRFMLRGKIHRALVTDADLNYVGSLTIDMNLLDAAQMSPNELVHVLSINTGARFTTYLLAGERGSREVKVNGAAARLAHPGDIIIVLTYALYNEQELSEYQPTVVQVDMSNRIVANDLSPVSTPPAAG
jgi:aspartate 1-decarboxylase